MMLSYTEPRCGRCHTMLVHAGALCVKCDDQMLYEAPIRSSPLLRLPEGIEVLDADGIVVDPAPRSNDGLATA